MGQVKRIIEDLQKETKLKPQKVSSTYLELVEFFPLRPISAKPQYQMALKITEHLINILNDKKADKGAEIYLQTLSELITDYEKKMFDAPDVSGRDMLAYLMELKGFTQTDIAKELGGQPNVSKVLKGERELNLRQIRALAEKFKVEPNLFI